MTVAMIIGITGQDGLYMAELLSKKEYSIVGVVRDISKAKKIIPEVIKKRLKLVEWDMLDQSKIVEVLNDNRPKELYNFAAYSSGAGMFDDAVNIGDVNGLAVTRVLDAVRAVDTKIRFCQASSSEMFGEVAQSPQNELTEFSPRSPYGAAKVYAHSMIDVYRKKYGLFLCSAILFNHESPRRGHQFVTRKISYEAAKIKLGLSTELLLGDLDSYRDWGFAGDYVRGMWQMLQQKKADDYVFATGLVYSVRNLCEIAFSHLDLDYRDYVVSDSKSYRPPEKFQLVGDSSKARSELNWLPEMNFKSLISLMVDNDLENLMRHNNKNNMSDNK